MTPSKEFATAYRKLQDSFKSDKVFEPVYSSQAGALKGNAGLATGATTYFYDSQRDIQIRPPFIRKNYEFYRPGERIPDGNTQQEQREIMYACRSAYERVGIIKSVIDMMSEFGAEGIEIIHPDDGPNRFYQNWGNKVRLKDRAERFLSWLYKSGNVVVRRKYGNLDTDEIRRMKRSQAAKDNKIEPGKIPLDYVFYDPSTIEFVGDTIGAISSNKIFALRIPFNAFYNFVPKNDLEKKVYAGIPQEVKDAIELKKIEGYYYVPLPMDKTFVGHYKKDDTQIWAKSFIYSILQDVFYNDKLKMAKTAALDGIINVIRLWKLGDHTQELLPSPAAGAKLANILGNHVGGGAVDIIWTSDIQLEEFYPPVEKLSEYEENYEALMIGLGIPDSLVGGSSKKSANNAALGLKNFIKRLEAGRRVLREWLEGEIDIIQKNMGFKKRPIIRFSNSDLWDERTYFTLLKDLIDRNILPDDRILEILGEIPEYEHIRMKEQEKDRDNGERPPKAGPFYQPLMEKQQKHELDKIKLQNKQKQDNINNTNNDKNGNNLPNQLKKKPKKSVNGRPPNTPDKVKRKRGPNRTKADVIIEAAKIYDYVDNYTTKLLLEHFNKENVRMLTAEEKQELDSSRNFLMANVLPFQELSDELMIESYTNKEGPIEVINEYFNQFLGDLSLEKITAEQKRLLKIQAYAEAWDEILGV